MQVEPEQPCQIRRVAMAVELDGDDENGGEEYQGEDHCRDQHHEGDEVIAVYVKIDDRVKDVGRVTETK